MHERGISVGVSSEKEIIEWLLPEECRKVKEGRRLMEKDEKRVGRHDLQIVAKVPFSQTYLCVFSAAIQGVL